MTSNIIEIMLYGIMTAIYVITEKKELLQPVLVRRNPHLVRRQQVER